MFHEEHLSVTSKFMSPIVKSVLNRFLKAFIGGAVASISITAVQSAHTFSELNTAGLALGFALFQGGIVGILLAAEKYASWSDTPPQA